MIKIKLLLFLFSIILVLSNQMFSQIPQAFGNFTPYIEPNYFFETDKEDLFPGRIEATVLSDEQIDQLESFIRISGCVQYFHPSDETANTDWDSFNIYAIKELLTLDSSDEFLPKLNTIFKIVAPAVKIYSINENPPQQNIIPPEGSDYIKKWFHIGVEFDELRSSIKRDRGIDYPTYRSKRVSTPVENNEVPADYYDPRNPFVDTLSNGLVYEIPLSLFVTNGKTFPSSEENNNWTEKSDPMNFSINLLEVKIAALGSLWNIMKHFYPYFDVVDSNWDDLLNVYLHEIVETTSKTDIKIMLSRLTKDLHDGHVLVYIPGLYDYYSPKIKVDWIEDKVIVSYVGTSLYDIKVGDEIVSIDGEPVDEYLKKKEQLISGGTQQWIRYKSMRNFFDGNNNTFIDVKIKREELEFRMRRNTSSYAIASESQKRPENYSELGNGIYYFDIDNTDQNEFDNSISKLQVAKGIIIDLRGYPSAFVLDHFCSEPITSQKWLIPQNNYPNQLDKSFTNGNRWDVKPTFTLDKIPKVLLTDGRAISYAESVTSIVKYYKLAEIVGEPTAGTNGNINPVYLPGGIYVSWTGMKVLNHDDSQHHGIGVIPDHYVYKTVQGIVEGKDEQLDYAINLLKATSVSEETAPIEYSLNQNYPNPFNPETVISYQLAAYSNVKLKVFNVLGREVMTLINKAQNAGNYNVKFDASKLASGLYIYQLKAGSFIDSKKMLLMK